MSLFRKVIPVVDTEPGITDPSYEEMFLPPDPTLEAVTNPERDLLDILEEIAFNTRGNDNDNRVIWQHVFTRLTVAAGEASLLASERVKNIYIPNVPRNVTIYSGSSRGLLLGNLTTGQTLQAELPYFTNGVFLEYASGGANEQINVYLSSKPIDISVR